MSSDCLTKFARIMILVDASAVVEVITESPRSRSVLQYFQHETLVAPELISVEVCSALGRLERAATLTSEQADVALGLFQELPIQLIAHRYLVRDAWSLRHRVRIADAFYLSGAMATDASVLTLDRRLVKSGVEGVRFLSV